MNEITIIKVKKKKDIKRFITFPFSLYEGNECWTPPLISEEIDFFNPVKNPYYDHSEVQPFMAERGGRIVGRLTAQTNKQHNVFHRDKVGFFGFFECINDPEVSKRLFDRAAAWLRERGCDSVRGPLNLSVNDQCGLLVDGFSTPSFIMMPYNPDYYEELITGYGFRKCKDLFAYYMASEKMPERLQRFADIITRKEEIKIRSLSKDKKRLKSELETIFTLYRGAWEHNWGFVPMTGKEYDHIVKTLLPVVDPDLVFIAYYGDKPVGFSVALPDYNVILRKLKGHILPFGFILALYYKNRIKRLRVLLMGLLKDYQKRGIDGLFYYYTTKNGFEKGFNEGEFSWVLEDNIEMNNVARKLGARVHKTYRIFEKSLKS
jgi:hypothetical protein